MLSNAHYRYNCRELNLFVKQNILPLPALYIPQILLFVKKNPQYLVHSLQTHEYNTRNKNLYAPLKHNTTAYEKGPLYTGQKLFNNLPSHIRNEKSIPLFKKLVRNFLFAKKVYCIDDMYKM